MPDRFGDFTSQPRDEKSHTGRIMPYYENVFIARQDISATQVDALCDTFTDTIEKMGGKVEKREYWGLRSLAYRIKKNRKGHYVLFNLDSPSDAVQEMERLMRDQRRCSSLSDGSRRRT